MSRLCDDQSERLSDGDRAVHAVEPEGFRTAYVGIDAAEAVMIESMGSVRVVVAVKPVDFRQGESESTALVTDESRSRSRSVPK